MRHLVITMSMYGPEVDRTWNEARVGLVEQNSAPSLAAQDSDFTWLVCLHPQDPLLDRRHAAFESAAESRFVYYDPASEQRTDPREGRVNLRASDELVEHWRQVSWKIDRLLLPVLNETGGPLLMTRLDDDDIFAADAFTRLTAVAEPSDTPTMYAFPRGFILWAEPPVELQPLRHPGIGFSSVVAPSGSGIHPYTYGHNKIHLHMPMRIVDENPAWVMYRHDRNMSVLAKRKDARKAGRTKGSGGAKNMDMRFGKPVTLGRGLTPAFRNLFPVRWDRQWA